MRKLPHYRCYSYTTEIKRKIRKIRACENMCIKPQYLATIFFTKVTLLYCPSQVSEHQEDHNQQRSGRGDSGRPTVWTREWTDASLHSWLVSISLLQRKKPTQTEKPEVSVTTAQYLISKKIICAVQWLDYYQWFVSSNAIPCQVWFLLFHIQRNQNVLRIRSR